MAVRLGGMCNKTEDCMNTSSNRRTECWYGVCSCGAGFKPTPNKDCVEVGKFRKHIKSCKNLPTINQISVLSPFILSFAESSFTSRNSCFMGIKNLLAFKILHVYKVWSIVAILKEKNPGHCFRHKFLSEFSC